MSSDGRGSGTGSWASGRGSPRSSMRIMPRQPDGAVVKSSSSGVTAEGDDQGRYSGFARKPLAASATLKWSPLKISLARWVPDHLETAADCRQVASLCLFTACRGSGWPSPRATWHSWSRSWLASTKWATSSPAVAPRCLRRQCGSARTERNAERRGKSASPGSQGCIVPGPVRGGRETCPGPRAGSNGRMCVDLELRMSNDWSVA